MASYVGEVSLYNLASHDVAAGPKCCKRRAHGHCDALMSNFAKVVLVSAGYVGAFAAVVIAATAFFALTLFIPFGAH